MDWKKTVSLALILCLLAAALAPAALAADVPALGDFIDRYGPLFDGGLDALTDWLDGQTEKLAPELRETLRDVDADALFSDLRELVGETADMDDDALRAAVEALAEKHGVHLVDRQIAQLMKLCRTLEKLDPSALRERTDALREELSTPAGLRGAWNTVVRAVTDAWDWIARTVGGWFR